MCCQAFGSQIKMCSSTKWALCQDVANRYTGTVLFRELKVGCRHCVYSWEAFPIALSVSLLSSLRLSAFFPLPSIFAATSVWWSTLLRWMNLIRVTPLLHFAAEHSPMSAVYFRCSSPCVAWQDVPGDHLGDLSSQSQCKRFVALTKLLQHDSVTLSVCWTWCNVPSRMYSIKSHKDASGRRE